MRKTYCLLFIASLLFAACGGDTNSSGNTSSGDHTNLAPETIPENYYKRFEGTIAGQPVVMHLHKAGNKYDGIYYYKKVGAWIGLYMDSTAKDSIYLSENVPGDGWVEGEQNNALLRFSYAGGSLKGTWIAKDWQKQYPIDLKEQYPSGSYKFDMMAFSDSMAAFPGRPETPVAEISETIPVATDNNSWVNQQLMNITGLDTTAPGADLKTAIAAGHKAYFESYKAELPAGNDTAGMPLASYNYASMQDVYVRYNDNGYVVFESFVYDYSGGAHGNYASIFYCLDVQDKKRLKLSDLITADSAILTPIVEQHFRTQYYVKTGVPLSEVLFEKHMSANDNFYFNEKGIGFLYNPYEVASYAQGQINVFIPFRALQKYIKPEIKQRLSIN